MSSIIFYVFYDILSTLAAFNYLGTFDYEKSALIKASFDMAGVPGFILIKIILSLLALFIAYSLIERYDRLSGFGIGILTGATVSGIFVGTSNMNIVFNGSSIWLMGMDSGTIAAIIILGCSLLGFLLTPGHNATLNAR
nr:hypothetical protein [Methanocella sp. CWC-04]